MSGKQKKTIIGTKELVLMMLDQPMKALNADGEEEITTLRKLWPRYHKKLMM